MDVGLYIIRWQTIITEDVIIRNAICAGDSEDTHHGMMNKMTEENILPLNRSLKLLDSIWKKDLIKFKTLIDAVDLNKIQDMHSEIRIDPATFYPLSVGSKQIIQVVKENNFQEGEDYLKKVLDNIVL